MKKVMISAIAWLACIAVSAQSVSEKDLAILDRIKEKNAAYTSIHAHFVQTKHLPFLDEDILSEGKYHYAKPDKLTMEYTDPEGDLMLIDGDKFTMIASGKKNETTAKNARMRDMRTILSSCMEGDVRKASPTEIICSETSQYYIVTALLATGKGNRSNISKVVVHYDKSDCSIAILRTEEPDGTYNEYKLSNKKINQS